MLYKNKILLFLIIFITNSTMIGVPAFFLYEKMQDSFVEEVGNKATDTAGTIAVFVEKDIENYKTLINREEGFSQEYYMKMLTVFQKLKASTDADYIFTENFISEKEVEYILDAESPDSENFSPIGATDSVSDMELEAFNTDEILHSKVIDDPNWGYFLTGFAPINDTDGNVIGLVGVDYSLAQIRTIMNKFLVILLIGTLALSSTLSIYIYKILYEIFGAKSIDYLTGLYTRCYFESKLWKEVKRRRKDDSNPLSILMVDVDHFKEINDKFGHPTGDQALKMVAKIIRQSSRNCDICARYGGDEFIVALPGSTSIDAVNVCNRMLSKIKEIHMVNNSQVEFDTGLSIGIAEWDKQMSATELISKADNKLLISKITGKNKYTI